MGSERYEREKARNEALKILQATLYMYRCQGEKFPDYLRDAREICREYPELLAMVNSLDGFAAADPDFVFWDGEKDF